jgi:uncharacterized protein
MSGSPNTPPRHDTDPATTSPDPSMEDILASIRRILNEDETNAAAGSESSLPLPPAQPQREAPPQRDAPPLREAQPAREAKDDVLLLDQSMMVGSDQAQGATPRQPAPQPPQQPATQGTASVLVAPEAAASASAAVNALVQALVAERTTPVHRSGPTIEDLVRDEMRPMLKAWLDQHLPPLVERLVRVEIERVVGRTL